MVVADGEAVMVRIACVGVLVAAVGSSAAQVTFEPIGDHLLPYDISADGTAVTGVDRSLDDEVVRWTARWPG